VNLEPHFTKMDAETRFAGDLPLQLPALHPYDGWMPRIPPTLLRIAFWAAAVLSLFMAELPKPPAIPGDPSDKVQHMIAFATLAALATAAYPRTRLLTILLGLSSFGGAIEIFQMNPLVSRDASWWDWIADTVAAGAMLFFVHRLRAKRRLETAEQA
jgi:VanZ family protein